MSLHSSTYYSCFGDSLCLLPLPILVLAILRLQGIIRVLFNLSLDDILGTIRLALMVCYDAQHEHTEAWTPDFLSASISSRVNG